MTQTKYKVQSKGTHASVFSRFRFSEHSSVSDKEQSRSIASLFGMNDDSNQSIAFTSMINLSRCVIVQAEGGKEERRRKKKERRERSVFFSLLAQIYGFLFCLSKLISKKVFIIIANKTRRNRAHSHSLSLTIFLSSLNNLHSPPQKRNVSSAYFRRCKIKIFTSLSEKKYLSAQHMTEERSWLF